MTGPPLSFGRNQKKEMNPEVWKLGILGYCALSGGILVEMSESGPADWLGDLRRRIGFAQGCFGTWFLLFDAVDL